MNEIDFDRERDPRDVAASGGTRGELALYDRDRLYHEEADDDDGLDISWIIQTLLARWYWLVGAAALGLGLALALSLVTTPLYRSSARLELNPPTVPIVAGGEAQQAMSVTGRDWQFIPTQLELIRSRDLAKRVVEELGLASENEDASEGQALSERIEGRAASLASTINVTLVGDSRLVELTYTSPNPREAAEIANGYAEAFIADSIERRYANTANTREFLANQLQITRQALNQSERQLVDYARANGIIIAGAAGADGSAAATLTSTSLSSLNEALAQAQQRRISAEQRFRQAGSLSEVQTASAGLRGEKAALEAEYREKSTYLGEDFPDMVRLQARIDSLEESIKAVSGTASSGLEAEYQAALAEENALRARVQQLSGNVLEEQELSAEYKVLKREVDTQQSLYQALLEQYNQIGVVEAVGAPAGAIVDRAQVPSAPFTPNIPRNLILGLILGLGLGGALVLGYEVMTDRIKTGDDVRDKLGQPLLGTIPRLRRDEDLTDEVLDPKSRISEAYGSLLTTLEYSTIKGMPAVLAITSAAPAEGKSTTSLVLAKRIAVTGRRVLLIDADLRRPSFFFDDNLETGLSKILTGHTDIEKQIIRTNAHGLCVLQSGPIPPNPSQLLNSPGARELLALLRPQFDHIIIDCPPALGFSDALLLGRLADATLMVVESGKTRRRVALEAIAQMAAAGNRLIGVNLTKADRGASAHGYDYNNYYYDDSASLSGPSTPHELTPQKYTDDGSK